MTVEPVTEAVRFFDAWIAKPDEEVNPLLLLAPFGCGKSVALGQFTLTLARGLKKWCESVVDRRHKLPRTDGARATEKIPWVPFPVRLRSWCERRKVDPWKYMTDHAQADLDPHNTLVHLTNTELNTLRNGRRLLPLFDGFDELPDCERRPEGGTVWAPRAELINALVTNRWYGRRHVLSSRPGHGVETDNRYTENAVQYQLSDLTQEEAERFIRAKLTRLPHGGLDWAMKHYERAMPAISELFRRPLFLAAWCADAASAYRVGRDLPTTLCGLMDAMLRYVLDYRLADHRPTDDASYSDLLEEVLENRHVLGAVLAIHADRGFALQVNKPWKSEFVDLYRTAIPGDGKSYKRYEQFSIKTGLMTRHFNGTLAHKIPIVEYLVGCFYAWLAGGDPADSIGPRHRQLATAFQRRFWWPDHDEVWLYAFDLMWSGDASQQTLAGRLVEWVLNLSLLCDGAAIWRSPLAEGQEESDRAPLSIDGRALCDMLPASGTPQSEEPPAKTPDPQSALPAGSRDGPDLGSVEISRGIIGTCCQMPPATGNPSTAALLPERAVPRGLRTNLGRHRIRSRSFGRRSSKAPAGLP